MDLREINNTPIENGPGQEAAPDVLCLPIWIVNVCLVGNPSVNEGKWVLVDAGLANSAGRIFNAVEERFGENRRPAAIILTHGHFDHVGSLTQLIEQWDIPVYAHEQELPYLTGKIDYPPPDPTVGGGLMAQMSPIYPNKGINLGDRVKALSSDGGVPSMPGWRWVHTPGHTPGHISLFRDTDRILIAGDAFTTVKQESVFAVLTKTKEIHGPPKYFTTDWKAAWESVRKLKDLNPSVVISSHGLPMGGE